MYQNIEFAYNIRIGQNILTLRPDVEHKSTSDKRYLPINQLNDELLSHLGHELTRVTS